MGGEAELGLIWRLCAFGKPGSRVVGIVSGENGGLCLGI